MIFTSIHVNNASSLLSNNDVTLTVNHNSGTINSSSLVDETNSDENQSELSTMISFGEKNISTDDINGMNLILNDADCSDSFFQDVTSQLKKDGISFMTTSGCNDLNQNNATVITLDQQYGAGPKTIIFAPYNNTRVGHSDSLALAMQAAFMQNGFSDTEISCGMNGFKDNGDGTIQTIFPTSTEEAIDDGYETSFITISLGTEQQDAYHVAKSIESALARQNYYLKSDNSQTDLIYRANSGDSIDGVANYFGTDSSQLKKANQMTCSSFNDSQSVINPLVRETMAFDSNSNFQISENFVKTY